MTVTPKAVEASKWELGIVGAKPMCAECDLLPVSGCYRVSQVRGFDNMRIKMQLMALGSDDCSQCSKPNTHAMQCFEFLPAFSV